MQKPTTVYDIIKELGYPHSSAYNIIQEYLEQGIIHHFKTVKVRFGIGFKKYYMLTDLGLNLLNLLEKINNNKMKIFH